ncbi:MAG: GNAT family N-acetyltransferase [Acidimicrobiia bacterium]|jgi:GNAT superfamily N-acetyltransferase|nr:GNAT family N-acetyltransferase [Acidimicrobiia bacterium]
MVEKVLSVEIRSAVVADLEAITVVHCQAALVGFAEIFPPAATKPTPASLRPRWHELVTDPVASVFVAETTSVVGCVVVREEPTVPSGVLLDRLYVHPDWWGNGIGSLLHDVAIDTAAALGHDAINLWVLESNQWAKGMYERRGWRRVPDRTLANEPDTVYDVLYQRSVSGTKPD